MHLLHSGRPPVSDRSGGTNAADSTATGHRLRRTSRTARARAALGVAVAVLAIVAGSGLGSAPAGAASNGGITGAGGGGGSVSVGAGWGSGSGGSSGSSGGRPPGGGGSSGSPWTCTYTYLTLNNEGGFPPGGAEPGAWYSVTCVDEATSVQVTQTIWVTSSQTVPTPAVNPRTLALQAENSIHLPHPVLNLNPSGTSVVVLPTWFWVDPSIWSAESVTATAGPVSATAVARPIAVVWTTGDGGRVVCNGPGTAYVLSLPSTLQTTDCSYSYPYSSAGQPTLDGNPNDGTYVVTATVEWSVSWRSTGVAGGGTLPTLYTSSATLLRVVQVESVNTDSVGMADQQSPFIGSDS